MDDEKFYLRISDWLNCEEHWFQTEKELNEFLSEHDTIGLDILALEVNRRIL